MALSENRFPFTKRELESKVCPPSGKADKSGRAYFYDGGARVCFPGLAFCITESGTRSYYYCYNVNGQAKRAKLGAFEAMTVDEARDKAKALATSGTDPMEARTAARKDKATLEDLWNAYESQHLRHKKDATRKEFTRLYDAHLAPLKGKRLTDVDRETCAAIHKRIGAKSQYTANRVLAILSAMFKAHGGEFGLPDDWTPTAKIKRYPEQARDRVLSPEELAAILQAIDADENETVRDYFRMMLYTGSRKGKLAEMAWQQISIQRKTWTVPGMLMKNGAPLVVNLVDDAISILNRRADNNPADSPYVFPARLITAEQVAMVRKLHADGKASRAIARALGISQSAVMRAIDPAFKAEEPRPFVGASKAWERILTRAGITTRTTPHDLRRTFVTGLLESGAPLMHVAASVGHRSMETTTKHYAVARQSKVADAVKAGVASMLREAEAAGKKQKREENAA
ncbi:MAG TPA: tyrosine-type recombinase/integrase [Phycisphaerae bacterium]|nr:tyrosine-type recombinase/integrase [Phycisphaerae bacterium]